jgi:hypothetical protein
MDEIQNCIADAQYGEALRLKSQARPNERFPEPGPEFNALEFSEVNTITIQTAIAEPLGSYFFSRFVSENEGTQDEAFVFECLANIRDFRRVADPTAAELVSITLRRLPVKFRRCVFGFIILLYLCSMGPRLYLSFSLPEKYSTYLLAAPSFGRTR